MHPPTPCPCRPLQVWAFILLAVVGGYIGSLFTSFNTWVCLLRKRWSGWFSFRVLEVGAPRLAATVVLRWAGNVGLPAGGWFSFRDLEVGASRFCVAQGPRGSQGAQEAAPAAAHTRDVGDHC